MIFTQFYLNHDESAGIVRRGVHVMYVFHSLTPLSAAVGIRMFSTDKYKSVILQNLGLWSPFQSVMMAQPYL